jgi:hypothetical protein
MRRRGQGITNTCTILFSHYQKLRWLPASGPLAGHGGADYRFIFMTMSPKPPRERPRGGGGRYRKGGMGASAPIIF